MNTDFIGTHLEGYQVAKRVRAAKHWLVRSNGNVIGPVSLELLERGLEAGKIPGDAEMALLGGNTWRPVSEIFTAIPALAEGTTVEPVSVAPIVDVDASALPASLPAPSQPPVAAPAPSQPPVAQPAAAQPPVAAPAPSQPPVAQPVQTYPAPQPHPAINSLPQPGQAYPVAQPLPFRVAQAQAFAAQAQAGAAPAAFAPMPIPPATPSGHYPEDPVAIPKQGMMSSLFG